MDQTKQCANVRQGSLNFLTNCMQTPLGSRYKCTYPSSSSFVRSKLTYGQEVSCSASKSVLKGLQSIDSKSVKLTLEIPVDASTVRSYSYREAGIVPLDEFRKLALAKYLIRASSVKKFTNEELDLRSDLDFPNRAKKNPTLKTIATFTSDLIENCDLNPRKLMSTSVFSLLLFPLGNFYQLNLTHIIPPLKRRIS